jgi:hypothetical protein
VNLRFVNDATVTIGPRCSRRVAVADDGVEVHLVQEDFKASLYEVRVHGKPVGFWPCAGTGMAGFAHGYNHGYAAGAEAERRRKSEG